MASPETPTLEVKEETEAFIEQQSPNPSTVQTEVPGAAGKLGLIDSQQWSIWYKRYISALVCIILFLTVTLTSETLSFFATELAEEFGINTTLTNLTITNFSMFFCIGPLLWCPLSEQYGRRPIYILCFGAFALLQVCAAVSQSGTLLVISRSLAGFFGSACLPLAPAVVADIWEVEVREREIGTVVINFIAPSSGVLFGGFLADKGLGWRGTCWVLSTLTGLCTVLIIVTMRETRLPALAKRQEPEDGAPMCKDTSDPDQHTYASLEGGMMAKVRPWHVIAKPYKLLFREPVLIISAVHLAMIGASATIFIRASVAALVDYAPVIQLTGGMAVIIGCVAGTTMYNCIIYPRFYMSKMHAVAQDRGRPEARLSLAIWAAPLFAACFFWFGWTVSPEVDVAIPLIASPLLGICGVWLMQIMFNYMLDVYEEAVATAVAWCIVPMYALITVFTVYFAQMFEVLGVRWTLSLLGGVAVVLVPVPILLMRYGPFLRARSGRIR